MMRKAVLGVLLLATGPVYANDSTAELATGGLVFTKTADIEMRSEDLSISEKSRGRQISLLQFQRRVCDQRHRLSDAGFGDERRRV